MVDNLQRYQLDDWHRAVQSAASAHQFLRMGATDHENFQQTEFGTPVDDHEMDDAALERHLPRLLDEPISFLDHYLREGAGPWQAPRVRVEVPNAGWGGRGSLASGATPTG